MRRVITQIGQSIYEWLFTKQAQDNMVGLGKLAGALIGTNTAFSGLAVTPTAPASLQVSVAAGEIYTLTSLEASVCGTLPADTTHQIVKQGISLDAVLLTCAPPATAGQSINYLIQAVYAEEDVSVDPTNDNSPVVLQFYNASNPTQPWSGPNNSGQTSATFRNGKVVLSAKPGTAATTGSQVTPAPDAGNVGVAVVTVANGQATITSGNISAYSGAPSINSTLHGQSPVFSTPLQVGNATQSSHALTLGQADAKYATGGKLQSVGWSRASNALTLTYAGGTLDFPNASLSNGAPVGAVAVPAGSMTVPAAATLGTISGQSARLVLLEAYNGGSPVLCVANLAGGLQLDEANLISPTTISAGATSAGVIYSASAVAANSAYRVVGFVDIPGNTGSAWAADATNAKGAGGQALPGLSGYGFGQVWQNLTASRAFSTTYYNTTGKAITLAITANASNGNTALGLSINGGAAINFCFTPSVAGFLGGTIEVPAGASYQVLTSSASLNSWWELR